MDQHVVSLHVSRDEQGAEKHLFSASCRSLSLFLVLSCAVQALAGCSREESHAISVKSEATGSLSPVSLIISATVIPNPVIRDAPMKVAIESDERPPENLTYDYQWLINRIPVHGATSASFDPSHLRRGDVISLDIIGLNGRGERSLYRTPSVTVMNAKPIVHKVVLEHDSSHRRVLAKVEASDDDQDDIHFVFRWLRNDKIVSEGPASVFDAAALAEKDVVTVEVTPHDGDGAGESVRATPMMAGNNAPNIVSQPAIVANAALYEYAVEAKDPDGDPIFYELEEGPSGMVIDRTTGHLVWKMLPGTHRVKVVAADGRGAKGWQEFDLAIPATIEVKTPPLTSG
jgi:hypothetical protein